MTLKRTMTVGMFALGVLAAPMAFAQTTLVLPPYNGDPPAKIATDAQALDALHHRGVLHIGRMGRVGDYWESDGTLNGQPVVAYVFDSGFIEIKPTTPDAMQSAALPPVYAPVQAAELPNGQ